MYCTCGRLIEAGGSGCDPGRRLVGRNAALSAYLGGAHLQRETRFKGEASRIRSPAYHTGILAEHKAINKVPVWRHSYSFLK
jgi:hypothetical protein